MVGVQVPKSLAAIDDATNPSKVPVTGSETAPTPDPTAGAADAAGAAAAPVSTAAASVAARRVSW